MLRSELRDDFSSSFVFCFHFGGRDRPFCKFFWKFFIPFVFTHSRPCAGLVFFFFLVVVWVVLFFVSECIGWWWWWWVGGVELRFNLGFGENTPYWDAWQPDLSSSLIIKCRPV